MPTPLGLTIDADAEDGALITLTLDAVGAGNVHNYSAVELVVAAPMWGEVSLAAADGSAPEPGQTTNLALSLSNTGSLATQGGTVELALLTAGGSSLGNTSAAFGPCLPGETVTTDAVFDLTVTGDTATSTNLTFSLMATTTEGYVTDTNCAVVVGPVDVSSPVGPDGFGYFAYDSADFDYPDSRPVYAWTEISTEMGGPGTKLSFPVENEVVWMVVDLPFTFRYYGQDYTQARVSDNGWVSFDTGTDYDFYNWTIPTQYGVEAVVAPFWDNLNPVPPGAGQENPNGIDPDGIYTYHDAATGAFLVEWSRLPHYKPEILGLQTFQVALLDPSMHPTASGNGEILFFYRNVNNNDHLRMYATVGIESPDGTDGLQLSYGNINAPGMAPLQPGLAVRVTTEIARPRAVCPDLDDRHRGCGPAQRGLGTGRRSSGGRLARGSDPRLRTRSFDRGASGRQCSSLHRFGERRCHRRPLYPDGTSSLQRDQRTWTDEGGGRPHDAPGAVSGAAQPRTRPGLHRLCPAGPDPCAAAGVRHGGPAGPHPGRRPGVRG